MSMVVVGPTSMLPKVHHTRLQDACDETCTGWNNIRSQSWQGCTAGYFMTQRSAEAPSVVSHLSLSSGSPLATARVRAGGEEDPPLRLGGGVELRLRRLGGEGDRRRPLAGGDGDRADFLAGEMERATFLTGVGDLALRLGGGERDLFPLLAGDTEALIRLTGDNDLRSTS